MRVDIRCGRPLTYPLVESPSTHLANEVTARIWPCVELQWAWLGGPMPAEPGAPSGRRSASRRERPHGGDRVDHAWARSPTSRGSTATSPSCTAPTCSDVYSYAYYRVGNHHDAEDLTEQTFLQAYRHFERAQRESNGRPLRPWLIRIAHNLAANYYRDRSRKPQTQLEDAAIVSAPHDTEDLVEGRQELQDVLEGVAKLPDDRREALIMRFALGMDNREIARALGRTEGATKVLIHRAIKQLEQALKEDDHGE